MDPEIKSPKTENTSDFKTENTFPKLANKAPAKAPVTQNAKEFESGDNFHLQPTAIWSKADTKQKWRKTDNLIFCRLD